MWWRKSVRDEEPELYHGELQEYQRRALRLSFERKYPDEPVYAQLCAELGREPLIYYELRA